MTPYTFTSDALADRYNNRNVAGDFSFLVLSLGKDEQPRRMTTQVYAGIYCAVKA